MIHLVGLEPIETRYTGEWASYIPKLLKDKGFEVTVYEGEVLSSENGSGDFLNWTSTNYWKSIQAQKISEAFHNGSIKNGDTILITDFWNPAVIQFKYMSVMTGIQVRIIGLAHAGYYDPWDRLHIQSIENDYSVKWILKSEESISECYDKIIFATEFHASLFAETHGLRKNMFIAGFPFEYLKDKIHPGIKKGNKVIFPQRLAPEKQPELFDKLAELLGSEYECVNMFRKYNGKPTKEQYHEELASSDLYISFSLQETLGITPYEALLAGCDILVPDRLSYKEIYPSKYRYENSMSIEMIADLVRARLSKPEKCQELEAIGKQFFSSDRLLEILNGK